MIAVTLVANNNGILFPNNEANMWTERASNL